MIKRITFQADPNHLPQKLADFELVGDEVRALFYDAEFQETITTGSGVFVRGKKLRPSDGRRFFDSLEQGFANSSRVSVTVLSA